MMEKEKKFIPIEEFVRLSPLAAPSFFGNAQFKPLEDSPLYQLESWGEDQNCYIYAINWPDAGKNDIFDVGDIYAYNDCPNIDLEDTSYLQFNMKKLEKMDAKQYLKLVREGAQLDGLKLVSDVDENTPISEIPMLAGHYLVVLYIDPEELDHHWYRLDHSGYWSHKRGQCKPERFDASSQLIIDPRRAARGSWTKFGGFFYVPSGGDGTRFLSETSSSDLEN